MRADQQFTIQEILMLHKPELAIPAFTKAKDQLDPVDVEQTCGIANIRVHMESHWATKEKIYNSGILPIKSRFLRKSRITRHSSKNRIFYYFAKTSLLVT